MPDKNGVFSPCNLCEWMLSATHPHQPNTPLLSGIDIGPDDSLSLYTTHNLKSTVLWLTVIKEELIERMYEDLKTELFGYVDPFTFYTPPARNSSSQSYASIITNGTQSISNHFDLCTSTNDSNYLPPPTQKQKRITFSVSEFPTLLPEPNHDPVPSSTPTKRAESAATALPKLTNRITSANSENQPTSPTISQSTIDKLKQSILNNKTYITNLEKQINQQSQILELIATKISQQEITSLHQSHGQNLQMKTLLVAIHAITLSSHTSPAVIATLETALKDADISINNSASFLSNITPGNKRDLEQFLHPPTTAPTEPAPEIMSHLRESSESLEVSQMENIVTGKVS